MCGKIDTSPVLNATVKAESAQSYIPTGQWWNSVDIGLLDHERSKLHRIRKVRISEDGYRRIGGKLPFYDHRTALEALREDVLNLVSTYIERKYKNKLPPKFLLLL